MHMQNICYVEYKSNYNILLVVITSLVFNSIQFLFNSMLFATGKCFMPLVIFYIFYYVCISPILGVQMQ